MCRNYTLNFPICTCVSSFFTGYPLYLECTCCCNCLSSLFLSTLNPKLFMRTIRLDASTAYKRPSQKKPVIKLMMLEYLSFPPFFSNGFLDRVFALVLKISHSFIISAHFERTKNFVNLIAVKIIISIEKLSGVQSKKNSLRCSRHYIHPSSQRIFFLQVFNFIYRVKYPS